MSDLLEWLNCSSIFNCKNMLFSVSMETFGHKLLVMRLFCWEIFCKFLEMVWYNDLGDFISTTFWSRRVFASPAGYIATSSSLPLLIWCILCTFGSNLVHFPCLDISWNSSGGKLHTRAWMVAVVLRKCSPSSGSQSPQ